MYQSIPFFGHIFLYFYFSLDYFYLSTQCICLLNLHCQRWSSFQIFAFYTFLHALGAGYRRKAKALGKHCLYKYHKYRITLSLDICEFKNINLLKHDIWDYFKFCHILSLQWISKILVTHTYNYTYKEKGGKKTSNGKDFCVTRKHKNRKATINLLAVHASASKRRKMTSMFLPDTQMQKIN